MSQIAPNCPTTLGTCHLDSYREHGFLAFNDVLNAAEVEDAKVALSTLCTRLRDAKQQLRSSNGQLWRDPNSQLTLSFERDQEPRDCDDPDLELKVRKFADFVGVEPHLTHLAQTQAKIQGVLSGLIGANAILMQNMALVKPPFHGSAKPWHQDDAYFRVAPLEAVCGVWIALDEAGADNGCMHVLPGGHRLGALRHYHGTDCEIMPDRLQTAELRAENALAVPLAPGGALFFSGILPHFTPPNASNFRRRALQFHYRSLDSSVLEEAKYDEVFVERDGTPASCLAASRRGF